jgi:hypothetical protein
VEIPDSQHEPGHVGRIALGCDSAKGAAMLEVELARLSLHGEPPLMRGADGGTVVEL